MFELNLDALRKYERTTTRYKVPSKFPAVEFDLAIVVDKTVSSHLVSETIRAVGGTLLNQFSVFDLYEGKNVPEGKKSLAFHLSFVASDRTLQDSEVTGLKEKIVQALGEKHGAQLR
jgi:phenylalanyl-tRNA synthetase beta chain